MSLTNGYYYMLNSIIKQQPTSHKNITSYRAERRYAPADRGGSTSVRGRIRSPHSSGGLLRA